MDQILNLLNNTLWPATIVFSVLQLAKLVRNTQIAENEQSAAESFKSLQAMNTELERRIAAVEAKASALMVKRAMQ